MDTAIAALSAAPAGRSGLVPTGKNGSPMIENVTFEEIHIGQQASLSRRLTMSDIELFATVSGDLNPSHVDEDYAVDHKVVGHGMWSGSLISAVLGTLLPGPGTVYVGQDLRFERPVLLGDIVTVTVTAKSKDAVRKTVVFDCLAANQDGKTVATGIAEVIAPTEKVRRAAAELPQVQVIRHDGHELMLKKCESLPPVPTAVVHPCDESSLRGAVEAAEANLIDPVLVGRQIAAFQEGQPLDYLSIDSTRYPRGLDAEIFPRRLLDEAAANAADPAEREHVTPYIYRRPDRFRLGTALVPDAPVEPADQRWCVDEPADYELVRRLLEALVPSNPGFGWQDCCKTLRDHPDWVDINRSVRQKTLH